MEEYGLLIDITSIQKYVFASNKLKENLGASYLVSNLYDSTISNNNDIKNLPIKSNGGKYKGYFGGGNALLFFKKDDDAKKFVKEWTKSLLVIAPGVSVATAIHKYDNISYTDFREIIFKQLSVNKSKFIPQIIPQRHGISAESSSDGYSMDIWYDYPKYEDEEKADDSDYISASTNAKLKAYRDAVDEINNKYEKLLKDKYCFTGNFEKIGQSKGSENHIAIVHIDGNSMGERFQELTSLEETEALSESLKKAVEQSFEKLLERIIADLDDPVKKKNLKLKSAGKKKILPIRPIILGGDDITFVCEGRMGIYYAKIFMEAFQEQKDKDGRLLKLTSCAGIAVIKTKYPFYKGYQIAEELCANAKSRWREKGKEGSWIDFHIAYGGFSGSMDEIRNLHYQVPLGSLIYRPYKLGDDAEYGFNTLIKNVSKLNEKDKNGKPKYPNNKLKELREVLTLGKDAILTFDNEMYARGLKLPGAYKIKPDNPLFLKTVEGGKEQYATPFFDMLEMLEYYPEYELLGE